MAGRLVTDDLWSAIKPLFPIHAPSSRGGRRPEDNWTVFTCLFFMLKTGIGWCDLPTELRTSDKTVRRWLKAWSEQGMWTVIFHRFLTKLRAAG